MKKHYFQLLALLLFYPLSVLATDSMPLTGITAIGMNQQNIAFSTTKDPSTKGYYHVFDLADMLLDDQRLNLMRFRDIKTSWKEYALTTPPLDNNQTTLNLRHLGTTEHSIDWSDLPGKRHHAFGFLNNGNWVSGGEAGTLYVYNTQGERLSSLIGHSGTITALAYYDNWLVSGDSNGVMILWDMGEVKTGRKTVHPFLFLAFAAEDSWVIWAPEGVFTSSLLGRALLPADLSNQSKNHARPDLLKQKLHNPKLYYKMVTHEFSGPGGLLPPPSVAFIDVPTMSLNQDVRVVMEVCDTGGGIAAAKLYLRGAEISLDEVSRSVAITPKNPGTAECKQIEQTISLDEGKNELTITARDYSGQESKSRQAEISYNPTREPAQMHVVTIAVSNYGDPQLKLTYPVADAQAISQAFATLGYGTFKKVNNYSLLDSEVTRDNLISLFASLRDKVSSEDIFVLYLAGHGVFDPDSGQYFFLPYNVDPNSMAQLKQSSIGVGQFSEMLGNISASRTLLLIDTCSGGAFKGFTENMELVKSGQVMAVNRLGRASLMASSKDQVAYEGYKGHGVFTALLLEALQGKADYTDDGTISVDELSTYVSTMVAELTQRKWGYRQEAQRSLNGNNFVLGRY